MYLYKIRLNSKVNVQIEEVIIFKYIDLCHVGLSLVAPMQKLLDCIINTKGIIAEEVY